MSDLLFLQTGGTIDKEYPQGETNHGYEFQIGEPAFIRILKRINFDWDYSYDCLLAKDSLDITENDRDFICRKIKKFDHNKIIITHGTDTIKKTASEIAFALKEGTNKTVVLTGAMNPEKFKESDADFNLGMALGIVKTNEKGVFVTLNGSVEKIKEDKDG